MKISAQESKELEQAEITPEQNKDESIPSYEKKNDEFIKGPFQNGYFFEPYGGIIVGSFDQNYSASGTITNGSTTTTINSPDATTGGDTYGVSVGSRLGVKKYGMFLGLDAQLNVEQFDQWLYTSNSVSTESYSAVEFVLAGIVGYEFPFGLKLFTGYIPSSALTIEDKNKKSNTYTGSGYKFGLGWILSNSFGINLEYTKKTYDKRDKVKLPVSYTVGNLFVTERSLEVSDILLSLSFSLGKE